MGQIDKPDSANDIPSQEKRADGKDESENVPEQKYSLETIENAPLMERRVYLWNKMPIFPNRSDLIRYHAALADGIRVDPAQYGGKESTNAPAIYNMLGQDGRVDGIRIGNSKGESVGWIKLIDRSTSGREWSTRDVWRPKTNAIPKVYGDEEHAQNQIHGSDFPVELHDEDYIFPILERRDAGGLILIGRPLPKTIKTNERFPVWIRSGPNDHIDALFERKSLESKISHLKILFRAWERMKDDPDARATKTAETLLVATQQHAIDFHSNNRSLVDYSEIHDGDFGRTDAFSSTAEHLSEGQSMRNPHFSLDWLDMSIDDLAIMKDEEFLDVLVQLHLRIVDCQLSLSEAAKGGTYSIYEANDPHAKSHVVVKGYSPEDKIKSGLLNPVYDHYKNNMRYKHLYKK